MKEGQTWIGVGEPDNAFDVWSEGIKRLGPEGPQLYERIFSLVKNEPDLRDRWRLLGRVLASAASPKRTFRSGLC